MTRAAIYARISDDRGGEGLGVARQVEDCHQLAKQRGWTVVEEYVDNDLSAYRGKKRPRYEAMLADIESGLIDAVIAYHQDRLTRQPAEFEAFLASCQRAGVRHFTTVTGYTDLGQDDGVMVMRIFAAVAKNESDAKRRRIRRKNDEKAQKGLPHVSGERAFGYERDGVTVREDEAAIIRTVADRFLAGESLVSLAGWLQREGVKTSTGANDWRTPTLRGMLLSPRIAGLRVHRGEVVGKAVWPAIISDKQRAQLVAKLTDPARRTYRTPSRYLLTGLLRCGVCGTRMVSTPATGRRRYGCRSGPDFGGCGKVYVATDSLNALITDAVLLRLDTPEMANALAGRQSGDAAVQSLTGQIREDTEQLDELAAAYAAKQITMREWLTASKPVKSRLETAEKRLARLTSTDALSGLVGSGAKLREQWDTLNLARQSAIINAVIDHIVIHPAERASNKLDINRVQPVWRA